MAAKDTALRRGQRATDSIRTPPQAPPERVMTTNGTLETPRKTATPWLLAAAWTALILWAGSDDYSAANTSRFLGPFLRWLLPDASPEAHQQLLFLLRKAAHVVEYAVLGLLAWIALSSRRRRAPWLSAGLALAWVIAVAVIDEARQGFVDSRTGSAGDIALDVAGGVLALALAIAYTRSMRRGQAPVASE